MADMIEKILLAILLLVSILYHILYKRQIKDLVKQLRFHKEEESNREIITDLKSREVKELQNELNELLDRIRRQRQSYEEKEEKIGQMVTDISHDIRTPLTSVIGYFQMLEEAKEEREAEHYKAIIYSRLQTLNTMLDEFFTYSKISQTKEKKENDICDVRQILCETIFLYYDDLSSRGIQPQLAIPEERFEVYGNAEDFRRIFMNLMKNALVHGTEEISIGMKWNGRHMDITFENKTKEPLPEKLSDVFERFFKGDKSRSGQLSTGLGLSIVKELTEQMDGSAGAFSRGDGWFGIKLTFKGV